MLNLSKTTPNTAFFSSCRKFSNQYHFYPFSCSCYRRHLFQSELHCFLAPVPASLFPLFHHCLRNHSSYFSTGAQGLGSPLLNVFVGFHNPVVHSRCNLLKSIFHLHTLVLASTVPLWAMWASKIFAPFNVPQKIAIDKPNSGGNRRNETTTEIELDQSLSQDEILIIFLLDRPCFLFALDPCFR